MLRGLTIVIALCLVGATVRLAWEAPSPGGLAQAHARLTQTERCETCHDGSDTTRGCLDCHREIHQQHQTETGYHAAIHAGGQEDCDECHGEHLGASFELVNERSWRRASPDGFDHEHVEFGLAGAHDSLECQACHQKPFSNPWPEPVPGHTRLVSYLGLSQDCATCHPAVHGPEIESDCSVCHDQVHFTPAPGFDHQPVFALTGAHAHLDCQQCHGNYPRLDPRAASECRSCHESPHQGLNETLFGDDCHQCHGTHDFRATHYRRQDHTRFELVGAHADLDCAACHRSVTTAIAGVQEERCESCHANPHGAAGPAMVLARTERCARCHDANSWRADEFAARRHLEIGFPLSGDHANVECSSCHEPGRDLSGITLGRCDACHDNPHRTPFDHSCADCHLPDGDAVFARLARWTETDHRRTGFALDPPHANLECSACHAAGSYHERYPGRAATDCAACHEDVHAGQFATRGMECQQCHQGTAFRPAHFGVDQHHSFTLAGSHRAVACVTCHTVDASSGVRRFVGTPRDCHSCHENPHGDEFREPIQTGGCASCHTPDGWSRRDFDHDTTGFALRGAHARAACVSCHAPDTEGRRRFSGTSRRCLDCHEDPHLGQLTGPEQGDCSRCHDSTERWLPTIFDHDRHSRYRLEGVHRDLACAQCHKTEAFSAGTRAVRFRPMGQECKDCHDAE